MELEIRHEALAPGGQATQKKEIVVRLGADEVAVIGNGRNDALALGAARLGILVIGPEGAPGPALAVADVIVASPTDALDLLLRPMRLVATLRP